MSVPRSLMMMPVLVIWSGAWGIWLTVLFQMTVFSVVHVVLWVMVSYVREMAWVWVVLVGVSYISLSALVKVMNRSFEEMQRGMGFCDVHF